VPKSGECENLLVPVCVSSSHIAFGSIRMEPVFMILGQSAATAAVLAMDNGLAVQDVDYDRLRERLLADGQILEWHGAGTGRIDIDPQKLPGIVLDNDAAELSGTWQPSSAQGQWVGVKYLHDSNDEKGDKRACFQTPLEPGRYEVRLSYAASSNRATNVPVTIRHADGETTVTIDQRKVPNLDGPFVSLGAYRFTDAASVTIQTQGTDGHVIVDAVQLLREAEGNTDAKD
jgi:hypothetical protein